MSSYPREQFRLRDDEAELIKALANLIGRKSAELAEQHIFCLQKLEKGNATMSAFESWCGPDGYALRNHAEMDELSRRLRMTVNKARNRARRILSKRVRTANKP